MKSCKVVRVSIVIAMVAIGFAVTPQSAAEDSTLQKQFEQRSAKGKPQTVEELLKRRKVPGVSVALIRNFEIEWAQGYGIADIETGDAVTPTTLFQAASISKPVSAMAALRAAQDGVFDLDDSVNTLLKSWQLPENELAKISPVTPRMLLSHTGGTTVHGFAGYRPDVTIPTVVQLLNGDKPANSGAVTVDIEPGTEWRYSGGGTTIMQLAMIDLFNKPFPEILQELVLDPVGMTNSAFEQPLSPDRDRNAARAHNGRGEAMDAKWHVYPELQAAGLWTTATDLCRFTVDLMNAYGGKSDSVLSQSTAQMMVTAVEPGDYGLGLSVSKRGDVTRAGHGGSNWGFRCQLEFNLDSGNGFCIMTNGDAGQVVINELKRRFASVYSW